MSINITIVEDNEDVAALVAFNLERQGWKCTLIHNGEDGWNQIRCSLPDLVILDVMLPDMDGIQIFQNMKNHSTTQKIPTLFLTARATLDDKLKGLSLGADDYITKPFSTKELVLRIRNLLERTNSNASRILIHQGPILLDKANMQASLDGELLDLTVAEFKLLAYLMERPGKVQDRYMLQHIILGHADTTRTRALDTHIKRLRHKLGIHAYLIATERGEGYYFTTHTYDSGN